jgi:hypothetical protein
MASRSCCGSSTGSRRCALARPCELHPEFHLAMVPCAAGVPRGIGLVTRLLHLRFRPRRPRNEPEREPPPDDRRRHIACRGDLAYRGDSVGLAYHTNVSGTTPLPGRVLGIAPAPWCRVTTGSCDTEKGETECCIRAQRSRRFTAEGNAQLRPARCLCDCR